MKICRKCNIEMEYYRPSSGEYFICKKCNKVEIPLEEEKVNLGNTFLIDRQFDIQHG